VKLSIVRFAAGLVVVALGAIACRQGDPLEPKTPPNSPVPTKIDRPEEPAPSPSPLKLTPDGGEAR
jgi:hypothetical protein